MPYTPPSTFLGYNGQTITGDANGAWTITANGTNQNVNVTPSGTTGQFVLPLRTSPTAPIIAFATALQWGFYTPANGIGITTGGNPSFIVTGNKNTLLGGLTTDGTGVLQFPAATTSAGGITMGTDTQVFRSAAGFLQLNGLGIESKLQIAGNSTVRMSLGSSGLDGVIIAPTGNLSFQSNSAVAITLDNAQGITTAKKIVSYNGVTTAGWGVPAVQASANVTAQSAANSSIATCTVGAADGDFRVSAQMSVTASTTLVTTLTCTYTDVANVARTMIFPVVAVSGTFVAAGAITGAGASIWETPTMNIRCKASTAITILTSTGTFTGVTYSASGTITQVS